MVDLSRRAARAASFGLVVLGLLAGGLSPAAEAAAKAAAAAFTPHRAVYDISLADAGSGGAVARASGKLEFEWADVCTGWTVSQRTGVQMLSVEGQAIDFGWTLNALETKDGRHYRFFIRRLNSDGPDEELRGEASLRGSDGGGLATYSEPEPREVVLPKGTLFPTAHSLLLIEAAMHGKLPLWRMVFDGSGEEGLFGVNAVPLRALPADGAPRFASPLLDGQKSWRIHLAYFGPDESAAAPEHEQSLRLFANGVVDELILDYGDFALRAVLEELEPLPVPVCR